MVKADFLQEFATDIACVYFSNPRLNSNNGYETTTSPDNFVSLI
jgi:hypothetical protein